MKEQLLFELIQVAIGHRKALSAIPSVQEWEALFGLCQKHHLIGVGYVAIQKLPSEQCPPSDIDRSFIGCSVKIKEINALLNDECVAVVKQLEHDGFDVVVIKGQSNGMYYPEGLREYRCAGDVDVWIKPVDDSGIPIAVQTGDTVEYEYYKGVQGVIEYARMQRRLCGDESLLKSRYNHVGFHTDKGMEVKLHCRLSFLRVPWRNWRLQRWFRMQFDVCVKNKCLLGFPVLTSSVNVVCQLVHLYEGDVALRHLMDFYYALRVWHNDVMECRDLQSQGMWREGLGTPVMSKDEVMAVLRSFGMAKFASTVMFVLHEVFAMPIHYYLCGANEKEGRKLLAEVNF